MNCTLCAYVMARVVAQRAPGVRLVQPAFHKRSLALHTKFGFDEREPLVCLQGASLAVKLPGRNVRPAIEADIDACNRVCRAVHGHDRGGELLDAISQGTAMVVEYSNPVTGYATVVGFSGHTVGECNADSQALIGDAKGFAGTGFLLPSRTMLNGSAGALRRAYG